MSGLGGVRRARRLTRTRPCQQVDRARLRRLALPPAAAPPLQGLDEEVRPPPSPIAPRDPSASLTPGAHARSPSTALLKSLLGTLRSCSFLASFVALFQSLVCLQRTIYLSPSTPPWLARLVAHKAWYWFAGLSTGLPLFIEEKKRRRELAMYVLPRGLESVWSVLRAKSYVPFVPGGEVLLTRCAGASLSLFLSFGCACFRRLAS